MDNYDAEELRRRNRKHQKFLEEVYREQREAGRYFVYKTVDKDVMCGTASVGVRAMITEDQGGVFPRPGSSCTCDGFKCARAYGPNPSTV